MAILDGYPHRHRTVNSTLLYLDPPLSPVHHGGGMRRSKESTLARHHVAVDTDHTKDDDEPPLHLPGPDSTHKGWDASNVSTAKCDMCHKQRCGTIQKCSECKLSVCKECALADRLHDDRRHILDPDAVSWDKPPLFKGRKTGASRGGRVRAGRGPGRARGRGRGRGRREAQSRPASSRATSTSFSPTISPRTDAASPNVDDNWEEYYDWGNERGDVPAGQAASVYDRPMKRTRNAFSSTSSPTAEVEDVAEILAAMPGCQPMANQGFMKRRKYRRQGSPDDNVLPPVRSVLSPRQSEYLPPLSMLHAEFGSEYVQLQPPMLIHHLPLPRLTPVAHLGHYPASSDIQAAYHDDSQIQGNALFDTRRQDCHIYQYPTTAAHDYSSGGNSILCNAPSATPRTQHPVREPQVAPRNTHHGAAFAESSRRHYMPPGYGGRTQERRLLLVDPYVEPQPAAYDSFPVPAGQPDESFRPMIEERGTELKDLACRPSTSSRETGFAGERSSWTTSRLYPCPECPRQASVPSVSWNNNS